MFRKATAFDLDAITAIYDAIHDREESGLSTTGWVRTIYPTRAAAEQSIRIGDMFVLEKNGQIIAAGKINQIQGEEYAQVPWSYDADPNLVMVLHTLVVAPEHTRKGIGTQFVAFYEDYALQRGCTYLRIDTNERNTAARTLYRKLGYAEADIVSCVFNGIQGVRLVCLEKKL